MPCAFCGGDDTWIKTCRTSDGSRIRVCDTCWEARASELMIVPGDHVITARCDLCGWYGNPREFAKAGPGGRKDAYGGTCGPCATKESTRRREE